MLEFCEGRQKGMVKGMAGEAKNRNALRSQRMLAQALSELILEMPYEKITVSAITRRADLNRGTFYAHYESVDELMREVLDGIVEKLFSVLDEAMQVNFPRHPEPVISKAVAYLQDEAELYRLLAAGESAPIFLADMKRRITEALVGHVVACHEDEAEARIAVVYLSSGVIDTAFAWLRGEFGDIDTARLERIICNLCKSSLQKWA